jgi:hypothetical protein
MNYARQKFPWHLSQQLGPRRRRKEEEGGRKKEDGGKKEGGRNKEEEGRSKEEEGNRRDWIGDQKTRTNLEYCVTVRISCRSLGHGTRHGDEKTCLSLHLVQ